MVELFFVILFLSLPFQFALNAGDDIDLAAVRILIPALFLMWLIRGLAKKNIWISNQPQTWFLLAFLFLALASLFGGLDFSKGARKALYLLSIFPVYFVASDLVRNSELRLNAVRAIWAGGTLAAAVALAQFSLPFFLGIDKTLELWKRLAGFFWGNSFGKLIVENPSWLVNVSGDTWMRAFGFFPDPHVFSFFASLCFFAGLGYFAWERNKSRKIIAGAGEIVMLISIVLSFSRGAYLGLISGGLFLLVVLIFRSSHRLKAAIVGFVFAAALFAAFSGNLRSRLYSTFNLREGSNVERMENWRQGLEITKDHPLLGVGLGNYSSQIDPASGNRSSIYAHNLFLDIAAETGILNGIFFVSIILFSIWRNVRNKNVIGLGMAAGFTGFFVHGIFDTPIWSPQVMAVFLAMLAIEFNNIYSPTRGRISQRLKKSKI